MLLPIGPRPVVSLRHAGALCFLVPMRTATTRRCTRRWRNFVKYTGDRSLLSFVARDIRLPCPGPDARFFVTVLKGQLLQRANPARGRFRSLMLQSAPRTFCAMRKQSVARRNAVARCGLFPGMIGWPKRHRISRSPSRNRRDGRRSGFSMCAGRRRWSSTL